MAYAEDLLEQAQHLAQREPKRPKQASLRRAVSTAYYALFHRVLRAAAERFMGAGQQATAGYALLYRSFDHGYMKETCKRLNSHPLGDALQRQLRRKAISPDLRAFAQASLRSKNCAIRRTAARLPVSCYPMSYGSLERQPTPWRRSIGRQRTNSPISLPC